MFVALLLSIFFTPNSTLTVTIKGIINPQGTLYVGCFKSDIGYPDKPQPTDYYVVKKITDTEFTFTIDYDRSKPLALTMYQDENDNGKIDKGWFGIPKEPFAFSNNIKPVFSAPAFEEVTIDKKLSEITIELLHY